MASTSNVQVYPSSSPSAALVGGRNESAQTTGTIADYALVAAFLLLTGILAQYGIGLTRILFIAGCTGLAIRAHQRGGFALHVQTAVPLFVFAPMLRRILDLHTGYDPSGSMLVGPLLALTAVFPELNRLLSRRNTTGLTLLPYYIALGCLTYGWAITAFEGEFLQSTIEAAKYTIPMLYCVCLILAPQQSVGVLEAAAKAFLVLSPFMGLYGVYQHLNPQPWDRFWMISSKIDSIGLPEPGKVRVFGTMNSPVSFAAYATCGLLLFTFVRSTFLPPILVPFLAILPLCLALLLTEVRTAWISAFISILVCLYFQKTRKTAAILLLCLVIGVVIATLFTSFGDVVSSRLSTLGNNVADDGSGSARLEDYFHVFGGDGRYLFGVGLSGATDSTMNALDGLLLSSAVKMGTVVGLLHTACVLWAGIQAVSSVHRNGNVMRLVTCALVVGNVAIFLLTNIAIGEVGFLYWMMVGALTAKPVADSGQVRSPALKLRQPEPTLSRTEVVVPDRAN